MSRIPMEHPYFGIFVMLILAFCIFSLIVKLSSVVGSKLADRRDERLKGEIYESGPEAVKQPNRMNSHFFLTAVLFILFDVEIIFMFPWAVNFKILGAFGLAEMVFFIVLLGVGFIYAWKKGALDWQSIR
ncbi:NAD(P)H-quinone oxidoreductase subunit 3 [uncultured Campylobacter sp.]|uniref:NAD(P)H-quinone oxidoreductase subunit 3 n=1 Tax=uncultured Campylobacter sp. TaxID=218934 RepID=UPI00261FD87A|nr:NAD(P)H-quinone oxidoreductase subunit 3 [uncultured Campylobacter sp.]